MWTFLTLLLFSFWDCRDCERLRWPAPQHCRYEMLLILSKYTKPLLGRPLSSHPHILSFWSLITPNHMFHYICIGHCTHFRMQEYCYNRPLPYIRRSLTWSRHRWQLHTWDVIHSCCRSFGLIQGADEYLWWTSSLTQLLSLFDPVITWNGHICSMVTRLWPSSTVNSNSICIDHFTF